MRFLSVYNNVVYVSQGTQAYYSKSEMKEIVKLAQQMKDWGVIFNVGKE